LVALKDNPQRTSHFLRNNIYAELKYIFADGSRSKENKNLFTNLNLPNITYMEFPFDQNLETFLKKMDKASQIISTRYSFVMDPGDFLVLECVRASVGQLRENPLLSAAGGNIFVTRELKGFCTKPYLANRASLISDLEFSQSMEKIGIQYIYLWYAIQKTENFQLNWNILSKLNLEHPFMEYLPTISILSRGRYRDVGIPQIIRVKHGPGTWTKQSSDLHLKLSLENQNRIYMDFCQEMSQLFQVSIEAVRNGFYQNFAKVLTHTNYSRFSKYKVVSRLIPTSLLRSDFIRSLEKITSHYAGLILPANKDAGWLSIFKISRIGSMREKLDKKTD
jgi:glycosyltransferase domain-containing protein